MDGSIMARLVKEEPEIMEVQVFNDMWYFMFAYLKRAMLVPGQVEQWVMIIDLNNMALPTIPRKHIIAYGQIAQENLMY